MRTLTGKVCSTGMWETPALDMLKARHLEKGTWKFGLVSYFKFLFKIQHILLESPLCKLFDYSSGEWNLCISIYPLIKFLKPYQIISSKTQRLAHLPGAPLHLPLLVSAVPQRIHLSCIRPGLLLSRLRSIEAVPLPLTLWHGWVCQMSISCLHIFLWF